MTPERHSRVKEICERVISLSEEQRVAYVEEACAGDPSMHTEVSQLLAADDRTSSTKERICIPGQLIGPNVGPYNRTMHFSLFQYSAESRNCC